MSDESPCPEEAALLDDVAHDDRPDRKRVYADWLEDHGRGQEAWAYRWAASRGLSPRRTPSGRYAVWERAGRKRRRPGASSLPAVVFDLLRTRGPHDDSMEHYYGIANAFEALAVALAKLKALYELAP